MQTTRTTRTTQTRQRWKVPAGVHLVVAFLAAGALGAVQPATGIPTEVVQLTQFGPALGVALAALLWPSRTRELLAGSAGHPVSPWRQLLATPLLIILLSAGPYALLTGAAHATDPRGLHHPFLLIALAQLVGACGEEIGWRCFLQPLLRTRLGPLAASVAVGAVWGLWHVQALAQSPAYAAGFLLATIAMSVVLGLALDEAGGLRRLLLAGGFHALVNLGMLLFMDEETGRALPMVLFGLACAVAAVPWVWRGREVTIPAAVG
ncbi:type II CAAX prenyl endopeptidase Rce1 family protein [Streptomyces sp. NPDC008240]|uniref:CPBP family intramembrane glutamic endopeptidase n=1 Tax=Streptomyces sp. NPDC008240 TaxID=3364822 RepID=UPI0036E7F13F